MSQPITSQPQHAQMVAQTTLLRLKKLNLKNYAAPSPSSLTTTGSDAVGTQGRLSTAVDGMIAGGFPAHVDGSAYAGGSSNGSVAGTGSGLGPVRVVGDDEEGVKAPTVTQKLRTPGSVSQDPAVSPESKPSIRVIPPPLSSDGRAVDSSTMAMATATASQPIAIDRPSVLSPLEMGTSPPFSMMADLGGPNMKEEPGYVVGNIVGETNAPVYWPWGLGTDGKERSDDEVRQVLAGIREKSTNSPVRKLSPTGRISPVKQQQQQQQPEGRSSPLKASLGEGRTSPIKESGQASGGITKLSAKSPLPPVISPQPTRNILNAVGGGVMPNWSRVGSGWNRGSPVTAGSHHHHPEPQQQPSPRLMNTSSAASAAAAANTTSSYTPPYSPTTTHQDSVYQAFVQQWCFAQGPAGGRFAGEPRSRQKESSGGGELVV